MQIKYKHIFSFIRNHRNNLLMRQIWKYLLKLKSLLFNIIYLFIYFAIQFHKLNRQISGEFLPYVNKETHVRITTAVLFRARNNQKSPRG